jgi:hypothetical protein
MLRFAFVLVAALALAAPARAHAIPDPFKLYGSEMNFSVWRKGEEIGQHKVTFARQDGALVVRSFFDIAIKFLGLTVYRYDYSSQETWRDGRLDALASTIDDNGTKSAIEAKEDDGKLAVTAPDAHETVAGFILPSTHWNAEVITASRVLNTLNGKVDAIKLVPLGLESVPVGGGTRQAMHYRYTGAIKAESWYDAEGHWLKLRFPGTDGTLIDYVCERCFAPSG